MLLEVCVDNLKSATNAVYNGADELEVCSCLAEAGLTPNVELVQEIVDMVDSFMNTASYPVKRPKVNVMIRCRDGWDFCYTEPEISLMLQQISDFSHLAVDRFVFGALTTSKEIDNECNKKILDAAFPKPVTFHRAYDVCVDPIRGIEDVIKLGFSRLLTSGQKDSATDAEAIRLLKKLIQNYGDKIEIMPGAGINVDNANVFTTLGCKIIHGTCRGAGPSPAVTTEPSMYVTDGAVVKKIKEMITC